MGGAQVHEEELNAAKVQEWVAIPVVMADYRFFPNETHRSLDETVRGYPRLQELPQGVLGVAAAGVNYGHVQVIGSFPFSARLAQRRARNKLTGWLAPWIEGRECLITDEWLGEYRGIFGIPMYGCALYVKTRKFTGTNICVL